MNHSHHAVFGENPLDRLDQLRDHILLSSAATNNQFILIADGKILLRTADNGCFFTLNEFTAFNVDSDQLIFLGGLAQQHYFVAPVKIESFGALSEQFSLVALRTFANNQLLPDNMMGIIAQANSILNWHASYGFCPFCAAKTQPAHGGWRRDCPACDRQHFPRTDPVAIMLVTHGDRCLLGRGHQFEPQRFSCLAGFIEPGETIEDGARRELFEEAGIRGTQVSYMLSQPWPFPSSLMFGMHVVAENSHITLDHNELAEAIWVDKTDIAAVLDGATDRGFLLPPRIAIARKMLEIWVQT